MKIDLYPNFRLLFFNLLFILLLSPVTNLIAQDRDSTFFKDDFNRDSLGTTWTQDGSWSIANGSAYNFTGGPGGTLKTTMNYPDSSYIIETVAMGFNVNYYRYFRLTFGQADLSNNNQLYQVSYTGWFGGRLTLSRATDNVFYPEILDEVAVYPGLSSSLWYSFKIARYKSGLIQVYIDNGSGYGTTPLLEAIDTAYKTLGHTGWQVDTDAFPEDFYVDWIAASKPSVEKPGIKEKPVEDSLITQVSTKTKGMYTVAKLVPGAKQLIDRDYTITAVPEYLNGASFIQTANDDKSNAADSFLTFFVKTPGPAIVYIGYDARSTVMPGWLSDWSKTGDTIKTNDENAGTLNVYSKLLEGFGDVYPYPNVLGGNLAAPAAGAGTNYLVAVIKSPDVINLQAEDALLSGAVVAKNHENYNGTGFADFKNLTGDYIEWTAQIDVPGIYNLGFKYANASFAARQLQITINGTDAGLVNFSPGFSRSWSTWSYTSGPAKVFLARGLNKIRVTATGTSGPNIDELSLSYSAASTIPPAVSSGVAVNDFSAGNVPDKLVDKSHGVYPNPFLLNTTIYYQLTSKARVTLTIFTMQGQKIQLLENSMQPSGKYQATFNAGRFAKGVYFYRLQIGNEVKTGKLVKE